MGEGGLVVSEAEAITVDRGDERQLLADFFAATDFDAVPAGIPTLEPEEDDED